MQKASSALGSTGTGVVAGLAAGTGTTVACEALTGGKNSVLCLAAGAVVGAGVGYWAASLDDAAEKSMPAMDCATVKSRLKYPTNATRPLAALSISGPSTMVVKPGDALNLPLTMDLATPANSTLVFKLDSIIGNDHYTGKPITKECGGGYSFPVGLPTNTPGVYVTAIKLINAADNSNVDGNFVNFCYTVATDGINHCPAQTG